MLDKDQHSLQQAYLNVLLSESRNVPLLSIDVQPAYHKWCKSIMSKYVVFLNNHPGEIYAFFNEPGLTGDTEQSIKDWLFEYGVQEHVLDRMQFKQKQYAFFRFLMDHGMDRSDLIKTIRYMVMNRINDSSEIEEQTWIKILGESVYKTFAKGLEYDSIHIPDISIAHLKSLGGCYLCGGGKDECLSEFRFLFEAFNIPYKLIKSLIY